MKVDDERPNRLMERFGEALMAADFDFDLQYKRKRESWSKSPPLFLFNKMMRHVNKMMDSNLNVGRVHVVKVVNYALMIATRIKRPNGDDKPMKEDGKILLAATPGC